MGALLCPHRPALWECAIGLDNSQITGLENEFGRTLDLVCDSDYLLATKFAGYFSTETCKINKFHFLSFNVALQRTNIRIHRWTFKCSNILLRFFILFCQGALMCANYDLTSVDSIQMWFAICDFPCEFHYSRAG